jgi:hippurate hydrolase
MPVINRVSAFADEAAGWRRDLHAHPELLYDVQRTAGFVAEKLKSFGVDEIVTGLGRTGVVGVIHGRKHGGAAGTGKTIALRADMDALPIEEATGAPWRSTVPGLMHACGHDGHTTMLLGAARYLAETRNFSGRAVLVFQPAEEGGAGAQAMCAEGLMSRFGVDEIYAMHNMPDLAVGHFSVGTGAQTAAADRFEVILTGRGGHAAYPHLTIDPLTTASHMIVALQTIASRNAPPLDAIVVSVTAVEAGKAFNVIPQQAVFRGTVRTLTKETRELAERRFRAIVANVAAAFDCEAAIDYHIGYPVTYNHDAQAAFAAETAAEIGGAANVATKQAPQMGAEDFAYMLEERPGAYIWIGNGPSAGLHHPAYDFNDSVTPYGASYFARLVERAAA